MIKKIKQIIHSYLLDQTVNIVIIITFLIIILSQVLFITLDIFKDKLYIIYNFVNNSNLILTICSILLPSLVGLIIKLIKKRNKVKPLFSGEIDKTSVFPGLITSEMIKQNIFDFVSERSLDKINDKKQMILDRRSQCNNIKSILDEMKNKKNTLNCLFVTGNSGAGKSILLKHFLVAELEKKGKKVYIIDSFYNESNLIYKKILEKYDYIIMDQFENALNNPGLFRILNKALSKYKISTYFIFSFPQDYFDRIYNSLLYYFKKIEHKTYFVYNDDYDIKQQIELINSFMGEGNDVYQCYIECCNSLSSSKSFISVANSRKYPPSLIFLCSILAREKVENSPLVEFSMLSYIYELFKNEIDINLEKYIDNIDKIVELYLNMWVYKFPDLETGKIALYLLSDGNIYTEKDIMCTTFEDETCFFKDNNKKRLNVIDALKSINCIKVKENIAGFSWGFSAVHDYAAKKIKKYCFDNLSNEIRHNIDYYREIMSDNKIGKTSFSMSRSKLEILRRYKTYNNRNISGAINLITILLLLSCIIISYQKAGISASERVHILYIFIAVDCLLSTYYIYNIAYKVLKIYPVFYSLYIMIFASLAIIVCFAMNQFWGVAIGIEIVILGITILSFSRNTNNVSKKVLKNKGALYTFIGIIIISFGVVYINSPNYIFHLFYIFYMFLCILTHIKHSYIIECIGLSNTI